MTRPSCSRPNCDRVARSNGLCRTHGDVERAAGGPLSKRRGASAPIEPVRAHIAALRATGLGFHRLAELSGVPSPTIQGIVYDSSRAAVFESTSARLLAVPVPTSPHTVAADGAFVDATGTVRRIRALVAMGHSNEEICHRSGLSRTRTSHIAMGHQRVVFARVASAVDVAFQAMQVEPAPDSYAARRARLRAKRRGWVPALAWDENTIDDPAAEPTGIRTKAAKPSVEIAELLELGVRDLTLIAERVGIQPDSVERQLHRLKEAS